jgi:hypothetical protein
MEQSIESGLFPESYTGIFLLIGIISGSIILYNFFGNYFLYFIGAVFLLLVIAILLVCWFFAKWADDEGY